MPAPLSRHYPSDDHYREAAIERVAESYMRDGDVAELLTEILDAAGNVLSLYACVRPSFEVTTFLQRLRLIERSVDSEIVALRREDDNDLTP